MRERIKKVKRAKSMKFVVLKIEKYEVDLPVSSLEEAREEAMVDHELLEDVDPFEITLEVELPEKGNKKGGRAK